MEWLEMFSTPQFWAGSVVVAILVNWISDYSKPLLDRAGLNFFARWSRRSAHAKAERERLVVHYLSHPTELKFLIAEEVRYRQRMLAWMIVCGFSTTSYFAFRMAGVPLELVDRLLWRSFIALSFLMATALWAMASAIASVLVDLRKRSLQP